MENRRSFIKKTGMLLAAGTLPLVAIARQENNITVILNVNTAEITNQNTGSTCSFNDQPEGVTNEEFTIEANVGDTITWEGVSSSSESDVVSISSINYEGGRNVFGQNRLTGTNGRVAGKVLYPTPENQRYKYKISFTVIHDGAKRGGTFNIDPKIQVNG